MTLTTKAEYEDLVKQAEINLTKELKKLIGRIERIVVPSRLYSTGYTRDQLSEISKKIEAGEFYQPLKEFSMDLVVKAMSKNSEYVVCKVDWDALQASLNVAMGKEPEDAPYIKEATGEILREKATHTERIEKSIRQEKVRHLQVFSFHIFVISFAYSSLLCRFAIHGRMSLASGEENPSHLESMNHWKIML